MKYILDSYGEPQIVEDVIEWARWYETANRQVAFEDINGEQRVSTVFLAIDHSGLPSGAPVLFETMIFGGSYDLECWRYTTRAAALEGHDRVVRLLTAGCDPR